MILCADIGGTSAKLALVDRAGQILARDEISTSADHYRTPVLAAVIRGMERFLETSEIQPEGIGVSATGQIDEETGVVIGTNGKIPGYEGTEIKKALETRFGVPVCALNDANAAALGECFRGKARGKKNVVMVTLGTGVGGGIVMDGKCLGGCRGLAGEIGHFTLYQDGPLCPCGKRGCFESYASTSALVKRAREAAGEPDLDGRTLFARARAGDAAALRLIARWREDVAAGLSSLVHIFNPEMLLIGGGVSAQKELVIDPLRRLVRAQLLPRFSECLAIEQAALGNDAGVIGAAAFWISRNKS